MNKEEIRQAQEVIDSIRNGTGELKPLKPEFPAASEGGTGTNVEIEQPEPEPVRVEDVASFAREFLEHISPTEWQQFAANAKSRWPKIWEAFSDSATVASVEGQRTGKGQRDVMDKGNNVNTLDVRPHAKTQLSTSVSEVLRLHHKWVTEDDLSHEEVQAKLAEVLTCSSVPGVEGMGVREQIINRASNAMLRILDRAVYGQTLKIENLPQAVAIVGDALEAYDRSLRGAGGEGDPDATTIAKAIAYWRNRALASESREQAMRECLSRIQEFADQRPFIIGLEGVSEMCKAALKP